MRIWGREVMAPLVVFVFDLIMMYLCVNQDLTRKTVTTLGTSRRGSLMQRITYPSDIV